MHHIYIDIGNTFTKYTTSDTSEVFQIKTQDLEKTSNWNQLNNWKAIESLNNQNVEVYVSCVRQGLQDKIKTYFWSNATVKFLNYKNQELVDINATNASDQIGSDILANAIAAQSLASETIVVSLGTAIVYFALIDKTIKGVAIDSGFALSWKSFVQKVWGEDQSIWPTLIEPQHLLGLDTNSALSSGFINSKVFAINGFVKNLISSKTKVIITGGDYLSLSKSLQNHLEFDFVYQPNLVLKGLQIWAKKA